MKKAAVFAVIATILVPAALAVDGTVLINQATVLAAGGFPYRITQSGSYRLSGNLLADPNKQAIEIAANQVNLDLNGFKVECSVTGSGAPLLFVCIGSSASRDMVVRNGFVTLTAAGQPRLPNSDVVALLLGSNQVVLEDLKVHVEADPSYLRSSINTGANSIVRHNVLSGNGFLFIACPALIKGNINTGVGGAHEPPSTCVLSDNVGPF